MRIFCEGEKTEPIYIKGYIQSIDHSDRKTVVEVQRTRKNTPVQLVEEAIASKESRFSLPNDEFWVVYDRESIEKYSDSLHDEARRKANGKGIRVALSNVCFEYWLLIHIIETDAPYNSYEDLRRNSPFIQRVRELFGVNYEKSLPRIFDLFREHVPKARLQGARLNERGRQNAERNRGKDHHVNPYMGMVYLLDAIDRFR
jgi:hypothetical protein